MKIEEIKKTWGLQSVSFWMTLLVAVGIIFIGGRFIVNPLVGADGFGIHISNVKDLPYGRIKGIRDIFSGLVLLPFLFFKMRKATAFALTTAIIVPAADFCRDIFGIVGIQQAIIVLAIYRHRITVVVR